MRPGQQNAIEGRRSNNLWIFGCRRIDARHIEFLGRDTKV
jgi:hypothetical protein